MSFAISDKKGLSITFYRLDISKLFCCEMPIQKHKRLAEIHLNWFIDIFWVRKRYLISLNGAEDLKAVEVDYFGTPTDVHLRNKIEPESLSTNHATKNISFNVIRTHFQNHQWPCYKPEPFINSITQKHRNSINVNWRIWRVRKSIFNNIFNYGQMYCV